MWGSALVIWRFLFDWKINWWGAGVGGWFCRREAALWFLGGRRRLLIDVFTLLHDLFEKIYRWRSDGPAEPKLSQVGSSVAWQGFARVKQLTTVVTKDCWWRRCPCEIEKVKYGANICQQLRFTALCFTWAERICRDYSSRRLLKGGAGVTAECLRWIRQLHLYRFRLGFFKEGIHC